ncbi:hypothetical protein EBO34_07340 [Alteribacter keqinensis]|uniref:Uncharacterized protein n=1 Tax=Alteribacter keqinensis TaxID=2483800 RepID=A0A3M7TXX0_9BACI|nr:hypothetical protein EBO34_07340 [Alteribacter keqinensis]
MLKPINSFLIEEQIIPSQIGSFFTNFYRTFIPVWLIDRGLSQTFTMDNTRKVRGASKQLTAFQEVKLVAEACIAASI